MPAADVTLWISLTACLGLVNAAAAGYAQPLVRSVARRDERHRLPGNWLKLLNRADACGALLLLAAQLVLAVVLVWQVEIWSPERVIATLLFALAMQAKLAALNRFVWLNGMRQIGGDKRLLAQGSALTLGLALVLAPVTGSVLGLTLASLLGALVILYSATQAARGLGQNTDGSTADWPASQELRGLVLLNLCGFLNLGTDVFFANAWLPAEEAVAYAFWSRALMCCCLLAGLHTQIRFPVWASAGMATLRLELRCGLLVCSLLPPLAMLSYGVLAQTAFGAPLCSLPWWVVWCLACSVGLACGVVLTGQICSARGSHAVLLLSACVAGSAPLLAWLAGQLFPATFFVLGYALANLLLFAMNGWNAHRILAVSGVS